MKVESLYIAMFDEVDEATAMFKTAEDSSMSPDQEYWLNLDADGFDLPSDWYLRCAGKAADTLRGSISLDAELGTPKEGIMTIRLEREEDCTAPKRQAALSSCFLTLMKKQLLKSA